VTSPSASDGLDEKALESRLKWWAMVFYNDICMLQGNRYTWVALLVYNMVCKKSMVVSVLQLMGRKEGRGTDNKSGLLKSWPWHLT